MDRRYRKNRPLKPMAYKARQQDSQKHRRGELTEHAGIVTGTLRQFAAALGTTPARVLSDIDRLGITPLNDTAALKARETHERPTDPALRSLALTSGDMGRLLADGVSMCDKRDHVRNMSVPEENELEPTAPAAMSTTKSSDIRVRVPADLKRQVEDAAAREGRSVSGYVRRILEKQAEIEQRVYGEAKEAA